MHPLALRPYYHAFLHKGRVLMTGHSHQAWPDVAREGMLRAFEDAALHVDDKWERALAQADVVRRAVADRIGARPDEIALGGSTHELCARFLSALDLRRRPHLVTTSGEFHSLHRQLRRLAEEGVEVTFVEAAPVATLAARLAAAVRPDTAALLASSVLFETSSVVPDLRDAALAAQRAGAEVLIDAYHAFNVVPFEVAEFGSGPVFVTAGGYKYAQWGEGCCFLRVPPETSLRPVYTGWFSDFEHLDRARSGGPVGYGSRPCDRFAGSTYDPSSHYRATAVIAFFRDHELDVPVLRTLSLRQTSRLLAAFEGRDVLTPREDDARGGFVALRVPDAARVVGALCAEGAWVDARGDVLRFGPAPYTTDDEIDRAVAAFNRVVPHPP